MRVRAVVPLVVLVVGSAVVVDPAGWQPFGPSKWTVVTVAALAAAGVALWQGVDLHRRSAVVLVALLGWAGLTAVTALDPLSAWIGTPDRRFGWLALLTIGAGFVAGQAVGSPADRRVLGRAAVVALSIMTAYGVVEALGSGIRLESTTTRWGSTFGSPALLGAALPLFGAVAIGLAADGDERRSWRWAAAGASAGALLLLAGSGTRAALVGVLAAAVITVPRWWPRTRSNRVAAMALTMVALGALVLSPLGGRILDLASGGGGGRVDEWRTGLAALADHPVLGTGLEGYRIAFPEVVDEAYVQSHGRSTITDRAHSGPLDLGISLGVSGAALWLVAAVWVVRRAAGVMGRADPTAVGMAAGTVGFLAQQLGSFFTLEVDVVAWMFVGVMLALDRSDGSTLRSDSRAGCAVLAVLTVAALGAGLLDVAADHRAAAARAATDVAAADDAVRLRPDSYRYRLLAADVALRSGDAMAALDRVESALRLSPDDPALGVARARILVAAVVEDDSLLPGSLRVVTDAVADDPTHPDLRLAAAALHLRAGRPGAAERSLLAAELLAPYDADVPLALAELYRSMGEEEAARAALERAESIDPSVTGGEEEGDADWSE